jgi:hypothetical protein
MMRRYHAYWNHFDQPDPYDGSYDLGDPQSFNRNSYTQNDPVNFVDPSGLEPSWNCQLTDHGYECGMTVPISWADELSASTGGPPEFGSPVIRHGDPLGGGAGGVARGGGTALSQSPKPGSFEACVGGLGATGFTKEAADLINKISAAEGTSRDLLAVTMMNENAFQFYPKPNYNGYTGDYTTGDYMQWDVGPFGLNISYTLGDFANKKVSFQGLTKEGVFGYTFYDPSGKTPTTTFDGVPLQNGRMAARRLNSMGSNDRQRAVHYAGRKNGPKRGQSYDAWHKAFAKFFKCYKG